MLSWVPQSTTMCRTSQARLKPLQPVRTAVPTTRYGEKRTNTTTVATENYLKPSIRCCTYTWRIPWYEHITQTNADQLVPLLAESSTLQTSAVSARPDVPTPSCCRASGSAHAATAAPSSVLYDSNGNFKLFVLPSAWNATRTQAHT